MSKGSTPRKRQVSREEYDRRWTEAFGEGPRDVPEAPQVRMSKVRFADGTLAVMPVEIYPSRGIMAVPE
jgi:hypothetical protein